ncbi:MAG: hypothetical protein WCD37_06430 [Chloroflexia bacterium]
MQSIGRWAEQHLSKKTGTVRGAPLYIQTAHGIVTLVEEMVTSEIGTLRGPRLATLRPAIIHVIDDKGVTSVPVGTSARKRLLLALAAIPAILWTPLQYLWLSRRQANEQKRKR